MSRYSKLIIDGKQADSFSIEQTPLNLKKRISNPDGEPAGSFTRATIKIPATKTNKAILEGQKGFLSFRIEIGGATRLSGFLQVKKKEIISDCYKCIVSSYEVALQGGNSDWFQALRSCKLDELTTETVIFDTQEITDGFNSSPDLVNFGFFFMKFREWENSRNVTESNPTGSGNIQRQLETPSVYESTPFLFIKPLVEAAFNKVGYKLQSTFLNTDFFKRLMFPVPLPDKMNAKYNDDYLNFAASLALRTVVDQGGAIVEIMPYDTVDKLPPKNPTAWNALIFEYTAAETGFYEVEIGAQYGPEVGNFSFIYIQNILINGSGISGAGFGDGGILGTFDFPTNETRNYSRVYSLNKGDVITIQELQLTDTTYSVLNSFVKITGEATRGQGLNIDFASFISKYNFLPMLKDLTKIFKLGFDTNNDTKTVIIEPLDPYLYTDRLTSTSEIREGYYFINNYIDYSGKIDFTRKIDNKINDLEGSFRFTYKSDDDETTTAREENERFKIYEAIFNSLSGSDKNKTKEITTEFFAKTIHASDDLTRYPDTIINPQVCLSYPFDYVTNPTATPQDANYDISPRLLYFGGQRGGIDGYIELNEFINTFIEVPAAFMVNYNDPSGLDPNLSFCSELISDNLVSGIVDRFHLQCLSRLSQRESKKASIILNSIERDNFTFRARAIINGKRYIIESIDTTNPLQNTPDNFLFILDEFANQEIKDGIESSNLNGLFSIFPDS